MTSMYVQNRFRLGRRRCVGLVTFVTPVAVTMGILSGELGVMNVLYFPRNKKYTQNVKQVFTVRYSSTSDAESVISIMSGSSAVVQ